MGNLIGLTVAKFGIIAGLIVLLIVNKKGRKVLGVILAIAVIALAGPKLLKEAQYYSYEAEIFAHENFTEEGRAEKRAEEARHKEQEQKKKQEEQDEANRRINTNKIFAERGIKLWTMEEVKKKYKQLEDENPAFHITTVYTTDGFKYAIFKGLSSGKRFIIAPLRFWGDEEEAKTAVPLEYGTLVTKELWDIHAKKYNFNLRIRTED